MLSRGQLCQEPQANLGSCPAASEIGHVTVGAGPGPDPVYVPEAGKPQDPAFLTGPYRGAPFGLSVVVPAEAGPFDLGTVVVRSAITVDPRTGQVTITSDPFPTILQGVPLQVKTVNVTVDRSGFMFNPTSCDRLSVTGTAASTQGAQVGVASPFQAAGCASLPFEPSFTASTQGRTSKANGASLVVKVAQKAGSKHPQGRSDAPGRTALAPDDAAESVYGSAVQRQPSRVPCRRGDRHRHGAHAGAAGAVDGAGVPGLARRRGVPGRRVRIAGQRTRRHVEIVLDGKTQIKKGITYSHFETVPDAPISSFETTLPEGPHSVLAAYLPANANGSFCG